MKLIYCKDEKSKDQLIDQGFKFLNEETIDGKKVWVFENTKNIHFDRQIDNKFIYFV